MVHKRESKPAGMVDVGAKRTTRRVARASSTITFSAKAFRALTTKGSPKGDVFETARVAGIQAAKSTPQIIPMCHPLMLDKITISFFIDEDRRGVVTTAEVACAGKTGVEMEALTAAAAAALTIYDMMKWADQGAVITSVKLIHKRGGQSGDYNA